MTRAATETKRTGKTGPRDPRKVALVYNVVDAEGNVVPGGKLSQDAQIVIDNNGESIVSVLQSGKSVTFLEIPVLKRAAKGE